MAFGGAFKGAMLLGSGETGEGPGEKLRSEVGETSAIGVGEVFQPKKDVSLFGPGDRGVFVIIAGLPGVSSSRLLAGEARPVGCSDCALCKP